MQQHGFHIGELAGFLFQRQIDVINHPGVVADTGHQHKTSAIGTARIYSLFPAIENRVGQMTGALADTQFVGQHVGGAGGNKRQPPALVIAVQQAIHHFVQCAVATGGGNHVQFAVIAGQIFCGVPGVAGGVQRHSSAGFLQLLLHRLHQCMTGRSRSGIEHDENLHTSPPPKKAASIPERSL